MDSYEDILNKDILELMGAKDMPEEQKRELYTKMLQTIENRVVAQIADKLDEQGKEEWKQLAEAGDQQKMADFLYAKGINLNQMMLQEALLYKSEVAALSEPLRQAAQS